MTNLISASGRPARPQSPRAGAALLRTLRLAPFGLLPLLAACGSLTGLDAGSTFNCGKGQGVPCTSVETLSRAHAARTLPHQREEEARAPALSAAPTQNAPAAGPLTTGEAALPADPIAAVKAAQSEDPRRHNGAVRLDGKAPGSFPRRIPEVILRLWIAPWTDDAGTFHTAETLYVTVKEARWAQARERRPAARPAVRLGNAGSFDKSSDASAGADGETPAGSESGRLLREAKAAFEKTLENVR